MTKCTAFVAGLMLAMLLCIQPPQVQADPGDTTWVSTLTFDSVTTRRGWFNFPDDSKSYRRVLMYYTLKCDPQTTADGFDCGEWDYLTYTNVFDHTGELDSNLLSHPNFLVNQRELDTYDYHNSPNYNYHQSWQYFFNVTGTVSSSNAQIGAGMTTSTETFSTQEGQGRAQYLYTAAELTSAGLTAGDITGLALNVDLPGGQIDWLNIGLKHTSLNALTSSNYENGGFTSVYTQHTNMNSAWNTLYFTTPFVWDGVSNVVMEFTFDGPGTANTVLKADDTGNSTGIWAGNNDHFLDFEGPDFVAVPSDAFSTIDQEITISFWQYGDPDVQAQNDYIFEGRDANGNRVLNSHLPWSNESVFWDAGNTGGSYDRISKAAIAANYEGQWNHWAFTKNATTGDMKIYLNGSLWHSGTGSTRDMTGVTSFFIGARAQTGVSNYDGMVDEFRVWDTELDETIIADWMHKDLDGSHPNTSNLLVYYKFNGGSGSVVTDHSGNGYHGAMAGQPTWEDPNGQLFRNINETSVRPEVVFEQSQYTGSVDSIIVVDSVLNGQEMLVLYANTTTPYVPTDTQFVWPAGYSYTYGPDGSLIDSTLYPGSVTLNKVDQEYYGPAFEVINRYEIGRFITPYGIGLTLGPDGFTWLYDVTDYVQLLRDSVDLNAGNNQELIDLRFAFIEGTPPREVKEVTRMWGGRASHSFSNLADDNVLAASTVDLHPDAESFKVITRITGHGHRSNTGNYPHCCEWLDNTHYLLVNGQEVADWKIFQYTECSLNPVYPQGGTWPGAREGWCPGDVVKDVEWEISDYVTGNSVTLDYDITDVPPDNLGMGAGNYIMNLQLMQYGAPNFANDAEVYDVMNPSDWEYYSRHNPICKEPQVVIRNSGSEPLTSLKIKYYVKPDRAETYEWTGNLEFMEKETVSLPVSNMWFYESAPATFTVELSDPNGQTDENSENDLFKTSFQPTDQLTSEIVVELNTNNRAAENILTMRDFAGNVMLSYSGLENNTLYRDTFNLDPGCYHIKLDDAGNDGLSYWADPNAGGGTFRIWQLEDGDIQSLQTFESEFGTSIEYSFTAGFEVSTPEDKKIGQLVEVYPNPTDGIAQINMVGLNGPVDLMVTNALGQVVHRQQWNGQNGLGFQVDLSNQQSGWYFFNFRTEDGEVFNRKLSLAR